METADAAGVEGRVTEARGGAVKLRSGCYREATERRSLDVLRLCILKGRFWFS